LNKKTGLLVEQEDVEDMSPCPKEDMLFCLTGRRVFLCDRKTCLLVEQEDMSPGSTRRHVFLLDKTTCLPQQQEPPSNPNNTSGTEMFMTKGPPGRQLNPGMVYIPDLVKEM